MKTFSCLLLALLVSTQMFAQAPASFNYQAVLRDGSGAVRFNADVAIRIDLLQGSATGTIVYAESFATSTNSYGLVNLQIGTGTVISGTFTSINWAAGPYFIQVSVDGLVMGTSQLLSVPYALYAGAAANVFSGNYNDLTNKPAILSSFNTAVGISALVAPSTGNYNTGVGYNALSPITTGIYNTAVGANSLAGNTEGASNTAIGLGALNKNTTGNYNTAIGHGALTANTTTNDNTAVGAWALNKNTAGIYNTAVGANSMLNNIAGQANTALGYNAMYNNTNGNFNTGIGYLAMTANSTGTSNTALGYWAMAYNTTGRSNTAVGAQAFIANQTGRWNTAVGDSALSKATGSDKNTAVGYCALASATGWDNTAVGYQSLKGNTAGFDNTALGMASLYAVTEGDGNTAVGKNAMDSQVTGNNNTAIGFNADVAEGVSNSAAIGYDASATANNKIVLGNSSVSSIGGFANWSNYSDVRLKENIVYTHQLGLNFITLLKPTRYNYIADANKRTRDGLIAQDVQQTLTELGIDFSGLVVDDDKDKTLNLSYAEFVVPLINAVQELNEQNKQLKQQEADTQAALEQMKAQIQRLEQLMEKK